MPGKKVAQYLFWFLLVLSMVFNASVVLLVPSETNPYIAAGVHACYPAMFAVSETLLVRVPKLRHWLPDAIRIVFATGSALAAIAGSAKNLALLAELTGAGVYLKWTLPLVLDLPTCLAMLSTVYAADPTPDKTSATVGDLTSSGVRTPDLEVEALSEPSVVERPALKTPERAQRSTPVSKVGPKPNKPIAVKPMASELSDKVAEALAADDGLTLKALAARFDVSTKTIGRTEAWQNRKKTVAV